jgi:hypothetical protein
VADLPLRMPSIVGLIASGAPYAVVGFIIAVIVEAFNRVPWRRTRTHVGKEQNEIAPSLTYDDAAPAIVDEVWVVWVAASGEHSGPDIVFRKSPFTWILSVFPVSVCGCFAMETATRARSAITKIAACSSGAFAAIADAVPQFTFGIIGNCNQSTKFLIGDIDKFGHSHIMAQP